jgi:hypothetical protein
VARCTCYAQRNGPTPPASLFASDLRSQPDVTAINRSAARCTCYAQRNGPGSGSWITCPLSLGARNCICEVNRARPQAVGVGCGNKHRCSGLVIDAKSVQNPCKEQPLGVHRRWFAA